MSTEVDLAGLEQIACEVARACATLIVDERPADLGVAATKSSAVDVVTVMDRRSEELASRLLRQARPHDGQLGEEGLRVESPSGITWVVDPIDGTVNYLYGIPACAVSVAAVTGDPTVEGAWQPVAGAVCNPETGELFSAHLGGGARRQLGGDVRTLRCSPSPELATSLIGTGFSYESSIRAEQGAALARLLPRVRDIRRFGSAALDLCHVADGTLDAYYERGVHAWDIAAGWLVCTEAGATVRGPGEHPSNRLTLAGSPGILEQLLAILDEG